MYSFKVLGTWMWAFKNRDLNLQYARNFCISLLCLICLGLMTTLWLEKYYYNKTNAMHSFLKFIFGIKLYMFRTVTLSIIRSLALYTQQYIQVMLAVSITCMTYIYCCVYNAKLLMMDRGTDGNIWSFIPKINFRN
jgi:hypothetical protein